jgi:hypothetical protein
VSYAGAMAAVHLRCDRYSMKHSLTIAVLGEGAVQAVCSCGWRGDVFGVDKAAGAMDPLQQAREAAELHAWDTELS